MLKILKRILTLLMFLVVLCAVIFGGLRILGYRPYSVKTESMLPEYKVGSLVYVREMDFDDLKPGDVITFVNDDTQKVVTHRITEIDNDERMVYTKGDNNEYPDIKPVYEENIIGKVDFSIPMLGKISETITESFDKVFDR